MLTQPWEGIKGDMHGLLQGETHLAKSTPPSYDRRLGTRLRVYDLYDPIVYIYEGYGSSSSNNFVITSNMLRVSEHTVAPW